MKPEGLVRPALLALALLAVGVSAVSLAADPPAASGASGPSAPASTPAGTDSDAPPLSDSSSAEVASAPAVEPAPAAATDVVPPPPAEAPSLSGEDVRLLQALADAEQAGLFDLVVRAEANLDARRDLSTERGREMSELAAALRALAAARTGEDRSTAREAVRVASEVDAREAAKEASLAAETVTLRLQCEEAAARTARALRLVADAKAKGPTHLADALSGTWDVVAGPNGDRGVFHLALSGTLVSGDYAFASSHSGSLQGTLIDGKVALDRVDARSGRDVAYYAVFTGAGTLAGTWESRLLGTGQPGFGKWSAVRRHD